MAELSFADIQRVYSKSLVLFNGKLSYIKETLDDEIFVYDLESKHMKGVVFDRKRISPLQNRIGMVNVDGHAMYVVRVTRRQYVMGLTKDNIAVCKLRGAEYTIPAVRLKEKICKLTLTEILDAYNNKYPSLKEAADKVSKGTHQIIAFDKQFAIDRSGIIYYKWDAVGKYVDGAIDFDSKYKYLTTLLEFSYEKSKGASTVTSLRRAGRN